jgi:hypothetical protein
MGVSPSFPRRRESRLDPGFESGVTVSFRIRTKKLAIAIGKLLLHQEKVNVGVRLTDGMEIAVMRIDRDSFTTSSALPKNREGFFLPLSRSARSIQVRTWSDAPAVTGKNSFFPLKQNYAAVLPFQGFPVVDRSRDGSAATGAITRIRLSISASNMKPVSEIILEFSPEINNEPPGEFSSHCLSYRITNPVPSITPNVTTFSSRYQRVVRENIHLLVLPMNNPSSNRTASFH